MVGILIDKRLIIVAIRNDIKKEWEWPEITHDDNNENLPNFLTVKDALNLLDTDNINHPKNDSDNIPMNHKESTIEKFKIYLKIKNQMVFHLVVPQID